MEYICKIKDNFQESVFSELFSEIIFGPLGMMVSIVFNPVNYYGTTVSRALRSPV